jgi:UDP-N-acetylmuramoyl-tripeptide--D-alanyl-D-alanine ligase
MIDLKHIKKCASVKNVPKNFSESSALKFHTDSRKYSHPSAFVAIPGAKVNPLDLIDGLLSQGAPVVVYQETAENTEKVGALSLKYPQTSFISVSDSVTFLQELSHEHIRAWRQKDPKNTVFAISGSNGKTTHKEILSFILKAVKPGAIVSTEKNNNNHLGVPLTLLEVSEATKIVVLELGSNHPGEIKVLCDIAVPNAGLTTNIGATHLEFFGTEEAVFHEEAYLYHAVKAHINEAGFYLINRDDPFLATLAPYKGCITYGSKSEVEAVVSFVENGGKIQYKGQDLVATNEHITGNHNKLNLITCAFIALHFFPDQKTQILKAASEFRPTKNRSEWIKFDERPVFLDAYNANPSSMKAALEGFKESVLEQGLSLKDSCIVLGDMNELGDSTPQYHENVGSYVKSLGFGNVFFVGRFASHYLKGHSEGKARASTSEFKNEFRKEVLSKYRIHFIKGSRSLQLESLFDIT